MGTLEDTRRNIQTGGMRCRLTASHKGALGGAGAFLTVARGAAGSHGGGGLCPGKRWGNISQQEVKRHGLTCDKLRGVPVPTAPANL